jgi:hypothetical protein
VLFPRTSCFALEGAEGPDGVDWTAIIPDAFPRYVYTWRMRSDGTYREDGRDAVKGTAIQETLSGRWTTEGARMILRQQGQTFVFDGVVLGDIYTGTLYFNGRVVSRFCAARGDSPPDRCSTGPGMAMTLARHLPLIGAHGGGRFKREVLRHMIGDEYADRHDHQRSIKAIQAAHEFPEKSTVLAAEIPGRSRHLRLLMDEGAPS